ncbi:MAG: TonB family protein [Ignavibacteria bacterium]
MSGDNIEVLMPTDYGAPELKKTYQRFFARGLVLAVIIHFFLISVYMGFNYWNKLKAEELSKNQTQQRIINVTDLEPPPGVENDQPPPPKIEEIKVAPPKDLTALTPEPVAKEKAEQQTIKTQEELEKIQSPVSSLGDTGKFTYSGPVKVEEKKVEEKIEKKEKEVVEKQIYQSFEVEKPPECVNLGQVRASMTYPEVARQSGIEGRVTVKVLVGPDGNVVKVGSVSGPDVFTEEVSSKAMNLQFTPGLQNGKPVKVWVSVPFNFKLKN